MSNIATTAPRMAAPREGARDKAAESWKSMGRTGQATILGAALFSVMMMMLATATSAYGTCPSNPPAGDATVRMG